ncbi:hypothetical protein BP5796_08180 [Coleophoma crateriformis]|uniref:Secreted protein n=1 Tax=Coleophoma crateriformis TaxID=565419 RepID=A0A3D8RDX9_9HELO|nr:hypothetical protein BP5796_08180 [Coleophoma crateriformis]
MTILLLDVFVATVVLDGMIQSAKNNLRADNRQNKRSPRQIAIRALGQETIQSIVAIRAGRTAPMASRAREDRYGDECPYEQHVEEHEEHPDHLASPALQATREQHGHDRVQHCGSEDALDGAVGGRCAPCEPDDLGDSEGE